MKPLLPFLLVLLAIIVYSCTRSADSDNDIVTGKETVNNSLINKVQYSNQIEYGEWHNKALDLYYKNNPNITKINFADASIKVANYLNQEDSSLFGQVDVKTLNTRYDDFKQFESLNTKTYANSLNPEISILLDYLLMKKGISQNNYTFLSEKILQTDDEIESKLNNIDNYVSTNDLSDIDKNQMEVVKSILISSNIYWSNSTTSAVSKGDPKSRAVLVADAVGALIWWETGPGSIIGGAVCSLIANEG